MKNQAETADYPVVNTGTPHMVPDKQEDEDTR